MSDRPHTQSPWRTAFELMVSRPTRNGADEAVTVKTVTTGTLAGSHAVEVIAVRQDGETLAECADRANLVYTSTYATHNVADGGPF